MSYASFSNVGTSWRTSFCVSFATAKVSLIPRVLALAKPVNIDKKKRRKKPLFMCLIRSRARFSRCYCQNQPRDACFRIRAQGLLLIPFQQGRSFCSSHSDQFILPLRPEFNVQTKERQIRSSRSRFFSIDSESEEKYMRTQAFNWKRGTTARFLAAGIRAHTQNAFNSRGSLSSRDNQ